MHLAQCKDVLDISRSALTAHQNTCRLSYTCSACFYASNLYRTLMDYRNPLLTTTVVDISHYVLLPPLL